MPATRDSFRVVVGELATTGLQRRQIAEVAGWTAPYLSQFLTNGPGDAGERVPSPAKIQTLLRALYLLVTSHQGSTGALATELQSVADRYELTLTPLSAPSEVIEPSAPNFVDRRDVSVFIDNYAGRPGAYAFDGAPMVGLSTALRQAELSLRGRGYHVRAINIREDLVVPGLIQQSRTGFTGALAASMRSTTEDGVLDLDFFGVEEIIREHFRGFPQGFALVLDDLDALDEEAAGVAVSMLRNWKSLRARGEPGFAQTTVWCAFTANVESARERSWFHADDIRVVRWFDLDEVCALVDALASRATVAGASEDWCHKVATECYRYFAGQPQLTHRFLWDRSLGGQVGAAGDWVEGVPYVAHLDRLAKHAVALLGEDRARDAMSLLAAGNRVPSLYADLLVARLRLATSNGGQWLPPFYRDHLPCRVAHRLEVIERRRDRDT
jgi:transcriptional regulator with XRE-family HTH domain